ncbi:SurA N-terminal domain-containing protein [Sphingomonas sp. M1-B02]|uniref:SurA N-terminal domain-containing protein n=1 Tax=Sphingomonas sp. M1-B02 TaxID=3114300 RepID=UPI0022405A99|nr:SurA N-terminal domain-containing protein [Sphingomonas sp. S6-11]UZK67727.1 SurA N-terminal domain-containing protein [Sphingomonas sp. S6-11]
MKNVAMIGGIALALVLGGCQKKAEGQVAAVVNGEEITIQEVNSEVGAVDLPKSVDKDAIRQQALQRIIERRLLAQVAKEEGLDKDGEYLIRRRALDDNLLAQMLAKKIGATIRIPEAAKLDEYIKKSPAMFGGREILTLDRIQFAVPADPTTLKPLQAARNMDQVEATLRQLNIQFSRAPAELDTARTPPAILSQINALPSGEPFILPQGRSATAAVVTARRAVPLAGDGAKPVAANAVREEELAKAIEGRLKAATSAAKIEYQTGFAPAKPSAAKKAASPAAPAASPATPAAPPR